MFPRVFCFPKSRINENGGKHVKHGREREPAGITIPAYTAWRMSVIHGTQGLCTYATVLF